MNAPHPAVSRAASLAVMLAALALSGCVSPQYKFAATDSPPPEALNLAATQPPVEAVLRQVILLHGPGSWKLDAKWDEYAVSLTNRGTEPFVLESATMFDHADQSVACGSDPWGLEKASAKRIPKPGVMAKGPKAGGEAAAPGQSTGKDDQKPSMAKKVAGGAAVTALIAAQLAMYTIPVVGLSALGVGAVGMAGDAIASQPSKHAIEQEFAKRRLALPATIAPAGTASGSLFFPVAPEPLRLVLRGKTGEDPVEIVIDLAPLSGLHAKLWSTQRERK